VISFWSRAALSVAEIGAAIDGAAPGEICALDVREVPRSFHASFSASSRRYVYIAEVDADVKRLDRMLTVLLGRRSFHAFARDTPKDKSSVRTLYEAGARAVPEGARFDFLADGFLRHQIRVLVATALREAALRSEDDALLFLAESQDRRLTAAPMTPEGLTLVRVGYEPR
jgi:tRNA pseudouridine38-40 synthase